MGLLLRMCQLMRTLLQHELMEENDEFEDVEIGKEGVIPAGNAGVPLLDPVLAQQILSLLKGLAGQGMFPSSQAPANSHVAGTAPKSSEIVGNDDFFHPFFGLVMTENEHDMLTKFLKLKTPIFLGSETQNAYEFILDCYEKMYKLGIVHQHGVEFMSFQLQGESKQWWREYMECGASTLPPLTLTQFHDLF